MWIKRKDKQLTLGTHVIHRGLEQPRLNYLIRIFEIYIFVCQIFPMYFKTAATIPNSSKTVTSSNNSHTVLSDFTCESFPWNITKQQCLLSLCEIGKNLKKRRDICNYRFTFVKLFSITIMISIVAGDMDQKKEQAITDVGYSRDSSWSRTVQTGLFN